MPPFPGNTKFVKLLVNLFLARFSPVDVDRMARIPLRIGVAGDSSLLTDFRTLLVPATLAANAPFPSLSLHAMPPDEPSQHWQILDDCQVVVVLLSRDDLLGNAIYRIKDALPKKVPALWSAVGPIEPWLHFEIDEIASELKIDEFLWVEELTQVGAKPLLSELLKELGGTELSAARKMPALRDLVVGRIIRRTARQNLMIAMASALPNSLPWVGPIVGLLGVTGEIIFLTSNQLKMILQIASVYDREIDVQKRIKEMLPVVGGAFGWRALSRGLVGFIPNVGPGIKGSIAFAGTVATGEAARWFYRTGTYMDDEQKERIYREAFDQSQAEDDGCVSTHSGSAAQEGSSTLEGSSTQEAAVSTAEPAASIAHGTSDLGRDPGRDRDREAAPGRARRPRIDVKRNARRRDESSDPPLPGGRVEHESWDASRPEEEKEK